MSGFEYEAIFIGIIVGLAIQNILWSFHKLVEARGRVRWHWMAPTLAVEAAALTLLSFWLFWQNHFVGGRYLNSFAMFLSFALGMAMLYLTCAATLPDEVPAGGVDLKEYYFANRDRAWGFAAVYYVMNVGACIWIVSIAGTQAERQAGLFLLIANSISLVASVALVFIRSWWVHAIYLIYGAVAMLVLFGPMQLKI